MLERGVREIEAKRRPGKRTHESSCPSIQTSRRLVDTYPKSAILSGSNQVLPDCILNQFRIAPNVKHFHDSIFVKSDGASGNV